MEIGKRSYTQMTLAVREEISRDLATGWLLPADQRFRAGDGGAGEIEFRLVEQHQFVLIDGAA